MGYEGAATPGVISRGLRGWSPLAKIIDQFGRLGPPKSSCIGPAFPSILTLLPKYFLLL